MPWFRSGLKRLGLAASSLVLYEVSRARLRPVDSLKLTDALDEGCTGLGRVTGSVRSSEEAGESPLRCSIHGPWYIAIASGNRL